MPNAKEIFMTEKKPKIEKLLAKQKKLTAQIQKAQAQNKTFEKKRDTRRKILVGSYFLEQATINKTMNDIKEKMNGFLTRNPERVLFGLDEINEK